MSLKFDRTAAGAGVKVRFRLENGKALLEWCFQYENDEAARGCFLRIRMTDREEQPVLDCLQRTDEEEPLQSVLLHPRLWQGVENPYLYKVEVEIISECGEKYDKLVRMMPLYTLEQVSGTGVCGEIRPGSETGLLLNGEPFCPRTVRYRLPEKCDTAEGQRILMQDMQLILELGANGIYLEKTEEESRSLLRLCERLGLLVWSSENPVPETAQEGGGNPLSGDSGSLSQCMEAGSLPLLRGEQGSLLQEDGGLSSRYYRYRAKWCKVPFVYIVPESIRWQENGSFTVSVYSSCKKVALYSNGILHEFQSGSEEFVFRGITAEGPCLILTAEAEECAHSLSVHKTFTKSSLFHDI